MLPKKLTFLNKRICVFTKAIINFIKEKTLAQCFPVNFTIFFGAGFFLQNTFGHLLLCLKLTIIPQDYPLDTKRILNVHKTFRRCPGIFEKSLVRSISVLCLSINVVNVFQANITEEIHSFQKLIWLYLSFILTFINTSFSVLILKLVRQTISWTEI